jgi:hypothetical protein
MMPNWSLISQDLNLLAHRLLEEDKKVEENGNVQVDWQSKASDFWDKFANLGSSEGLDITGYSKGIQEEFKD